MISRARPSLSTTANGSPASGAEFEPQDLDRHRRPGLADRLAAVVDQRAHAPPRRTGNDDVADPQRAALHQCGADRTAPALELGLDHDALRRPFGIGGEVQQLGLQADRLQQLVEAGPLQGRHLDLERLARHALDDDLVLQQRRAHPVGIAAGLVHLVDGHDQRHLCGLGVIDRLHRLRHHTVVGGNHQHHDVGHLGAALAHGRERLVARRIDEGDLLAAGRRHLIGADVLGDAARLAGGNVGVTNGVEQRRLAVVDVTHDGDHRRPWLLAFAGVGLTDEAFLHVGLRHALGRVAELAHDELRRVGVDDIVDLVHRALPHQQLDDVDGALRHAVGELLDGDHLGDDHLAHDLVARLHDAGLAQLLALAPTAQRSQRALPLRLVEGVVDGELDALAPLIAGLDGTLGRLGTLLLGARFLLRLGLDLEGTGTALGDLPWRLDALGFFTRARLVCRRLGWHHIRLDHLLPRLDRGRDGHLYFLGLGLGHRLGLRGVKRLETGTLGRFRLGAFLGRLERTPTRIELVGGKAARPLHHLGEQALRLLDLGTFGVGATGGGDRALLLLLDHHRLRSAVAEALLDVAGIDRPLQAQRLARRRAAQCLLGDFLRFRHARPVFGSRCRQQATVWG